MAEGKGVVVCAGASLSLLLYSLVVKQLRLFSPRENEVFLGKCSGWGSSALSLLPPL